MHDAIMAPFHRGWLRTFSSLAIPHFRMLWIGTLAVTAAMQIDIIARAWLAYAITGSGLALGAVGLARGIAMLGFSLFAGVAADRFDKRTLLIATQGGLAVIALANAVLVHLAIIQIWHLVAFGLLQGAVFACSIPARQSYVPELVPNKQMPNAVALNSIAMNLNRMLAPVLAGLLLTVNPASAFYAVAAFYGLAAVTLLRLPASHGPAESPRNPLTDIAVGFRYVWNQPVLRTLIGMALITEFFGLPYQQLLPVFQVDVLHVTPSQLGFMYSAAGVGSLVGSVAAARLSEHTRLCLFQLIAGVGFGVALAAFSLSTEFDLSLGLLLLVGLTSQAYLVFTNVLILLYSDHRLRGRVMSIYSTTWSLNGVALIPLGALVDFAGAPTTVFSAGAVMAVAVAAVAVLQPAYRRMDSAPVAPAPTRP